MNAWNALVALTAFAAGWVPWVALSVIALVVLVMVGRDRYSRKLRLAASAEAAEIDALLRDGKITNAEAQLLQRQCNALPEVEEVAPVPDLSLRLAAAVSRIYAVMVLMTLLFTIVLAGVALLPRMEVSGIGQAVKDIPAWWQMALLGVIWLVHLTVAIGQFRASRWILEGSSRARSWLGAAWLVNFLMLQQAFGARYWAPVVGLFVLWVLFWRPGAAAKISKRIPPQAWWRKWALALAAMAALAGGMCWNLNYAYAAMSQHQVTVYSSRGAIPARLEQLHILCGTPERSVRRVAEELAAKFREAGIPVAMHRAGEGPVRLDADRELAIWIGAGKVMATRNDPNDKLSLLSPYMRMGTEHLEGGPCFRIVNFDKFRRSSEWKGLVFPRFVCSIALDVAVNGGAAGERDVVKKAVAQFLPLLQKLTGPEALRVPKLALPPAQPAWQAPDLRDFRQVLQTRGVGGQVDVYAFSPGDYDADLAAVRALLQQHGFGEERERFNGVFHFSSHQPRWEEAELYYWRSLETPKRSFFAETRMEADTALLVVGASDAPDNTPDPELTARFAAEDPVAFLCSDGIYLLDPAEREAMLTHFWSLPDMPRNIRRKVLDTTMQSRLGLSERERELQQVNFRRTAAEILADGANGEFSYEVEALLETARKEVVPGLTDWLLAELGDLRQVVKLDGEPGADGMIRVETLLPLPDPKFFRCRLEYDFGRYAYRPHKTWITLTTKADGMVRLVKGDSEITFSPAAKQRPVGFFIGSKLGNGDGKPPWELSELTWGEDYVALDRKPEPGGLLLTGRFEPENGVLRLHCIFAPVPLEPESD